MKKKTALPFLTRYYSTSELARAVGVHANTVRRYVDWGLLPPVERGPNGYRRFTRHHLDCLRLDRLVMGGNYYPGRSIHRSGSLIIQSAVRDDWGGTLELAYQHLALVRAEKAQANAAVELLEHWAQGGGADVTSRPLRIGETAKLLGVSHDILRNWERNGLLDVPRQENNAYRLYGPREIGRLRVIRMLAKAGYSLMAILRMLLQLDHGETRNLRQALDTPHPDEDVYMASDRWLSTLNFEEDRARRIIEFVESVIQNRVSSG
ncbi:MAG: MerR family transcriptional regulator [Leptolinea sp.]|jgi:DNA-binding transcriptional MerR regulator|nr:MerR family transcriptional regulator [Leptolinea sp.]